MRILVTGGAGYIGSHTVLLLLEAGHHVEVLDNLSNSSRESLLRVAELAGQTVPLHVADLLDVSSLDKAFSLSKPDAVIHFAGLKAVGESEREPLRYYKNNVTGTLNILECMDAHSVRNFVFSSSATVYGSAGGEVKYTEDLPLVPINTYGRTKMQVEQILDDLASSDSRWAIAKLRYFNPVGAHESGRIGEDPTGVPNNLMPFISQVAVGRRPELQIFGDDYPTPDGTGIRDYIHVVDLAAAHLAALEYCVDNNGSHAWNIGTGHGSSVFEVMRAFERVSGNEISYKLVDRRPGDLPEYFADPTLAREELGWKAERGLEEMVQDNWRWQSSNPTGYPDNSPNSAVELQQDEGLEIPRTDVDEEPKSDEAAKV